MKKLRDYLTEPHSWLAVVTYALLLWALLSNLSHVLAFIGKFLGYLYPFFLAIAIAFVLNIPMSQCERFLDRHLSAKSRLRKGIRSWSILFAYLLAFLIIGLFAYLIIPPLFRSVSSFFSNLVSFLNGIIANLDKIMAYFNLEPLDVSFDNATIQKFFSELGLDWQSLVKSLSGVLTSGGSAMLDRIISISASLGSWLLGIMLAAYLLASKETLIRQARKLVAAVFPLPVTEAIFRVFHRADDVFSHFISGQLVEALVIGGLEYAVMVIFRIPYAELIACIVTVMALVPVFGATLACLVGFLLVFSVSSWKAVLFVIIYQCTQQIENVVIYPRVVGRSVGLPGIWTLLSIVVFGGMFGVFGMLVAVPFTSLIYSFGSELVNRSLAHKHLKITTSDLQDTSAEDRPAS